MSGPKAYIFLNGDFEKPGRDWPEKPAEDDLIIAADGGARHAAALDWPVHCLVGDFDSIEQNMLWRLKSQGTEFFQFPAEKDEIDFELAVKLAHKKGFMDLEILGALGGRWDMSFGNLFLPRASGWGSEMMRFRHGDWTFLAVSGPASLSVDGEAGDLLSLLPLGEDVRNLRLVGCRYPLNGETLKAGLSRGLSNEIVKPPARLEFASGSLLVITRAGTTA